MFDECPEDGGDEEPMSDYLITANAFLISLQSGLDWFALHELFMQSPDALTFEGLCRLEVYKLKDARNGA
jgi:hypothetical protein